MTLKQFHFRSNIQRAGETFIVFCNRVLLEAKDCSFKSASDKCTAEEDTTIRDQIITGTKDNDICKEALQGSNECIMIRKNDSFFINQSFSHLA